jgi:predicted phage gp36 major capsid-like protein
MNAQDREGIHRVEQLLRQHADHEERWRSQLKDELDELRDELRAQSSRQEEWNKRFDQRQRDLEHQMATRSGIAKAAGWIIGLITTLGAIAAALFKVKL